MIDKHEQYLEISEIWHFRNLARTQIDHEEEVKAIREEMELERKRLEKESKATTSSSGWLGGWFGSKKKSESDREENEERRKQIEREKEGKMREARERILKMERDFKEAENLMEYDPDEVPFWEQMKALDKMATVRFHQKCISVSLRDEDETKRILTTLRVQDLFADVCARVSYIELSMRVQNLDISDNYVKDTKYPHIVSYVSLKIVCVQLHRSRVLKITRSSLQQLAFALEIVCVLD